MYECSYVGDPHCATLFICWLSKCYYIITIQSILTLSECTLLSAQETSMCFLSQFPNIHFSVCNLMFVAVLCVFVLIGLPKYLKEHAVDFETSSYSFIRQINYSNCILEFDSKRLQAWILCGGLCWPYALICA